MPYAGSGSGSGSDEEETPVIQPSTYTSSESSFAPTPPISSVIDSSESNIFYFEETASSSTSEHISPSLYIPSWDTALFTTSTSSSWEIWITKDPWESRDKERSRDTWHSEVTESSTDVFSSRKTDHYTDIWYSRKEISTDVWSSKDTEPSTDVWYSRKDDSTDIWSSKKLETSTGMWYSKKDYSSHIWSSKEREPSTDVWYNRKEKSTDIWSSRETEHSTDGWYSKEADYSTVVVESKETKYSRGGWWLEIKPTREVWHTSSSSLYDEERSSETFRTHETPSPFYSTISTRPSSSMVQFEKVSSSQELPPYSYPSSRSSTFRDIQGEFSSSIGGYIPTTSRVASVYIEEDVVTKYPEKSSSVYRSSMIFDDCSRSGTCTTSPKLESSSSWTYERVAPTYSISSTESTTMTPILPVTLPTEKKQYTTTSQPDTEQKKTTKKPKKRPTQPPFIITTGKLAI